MRDSIQQSTWVEVDLDALAANVRALRRQAGAALLMAVVKANAYGHGAVPVAEAAVTAGADWLGVAFADEGMALRQAGLTAPILILGYSPPTAADKVVAQRLTPAVADWSVAVALSAAAARAGVRQDVHVKVDTGMHRFGLDPADVLAFVAGLEQLPNLRFAGLFTHFATADEADKTGARQQLARFQMVRQALATAGRPAPLSHAAASAAILDLPEAHLDLVRAGISLYGLYPSSVVSRAVPLRPVLQWKTRVARVFDVAAGEGVSYGFTWRAPSPARLALLPVGYGDGFRRGLSNRGQVLIAGRRAPIRGRVCMDQTVVEVTQIPGVRPGDEVVLIGRQEEETITVEEMAEWLGTINYEVVTGLMARLPRLYL